jgi:hypothetical protein
MWDRSTLGMTGSERELHEALTAMERALGCDELDSIARSALATAIGALRRQLARVRTATRGADRDPALG